MGLYEHILRPAIFKLGPESAHSMSIAALKSGALPGSPNNRYSSLSTQLLGLNFPNPVGMAAGYDKNGEVCAGVLNLGFGFHEAGTVTPRPQSGNPKPRLFRLVNDKAIINRMGFNNCGHAEFFKNFDATMANSKTGPCGINIGANKDSKDFAEDYCIGLKRFWQKADYFTANISSPNTPGLRDLQASEALNSLLDRLGRTANELEKNHKLHRPILLKIAPDLDPKQMDDIATSVKNSVISGLIVSNTTLSRAGLTDRNAQEAGGLSGRPLFALSTHILAMMRQRMGKDFVIIGAGGIEGWRDAWRKFEAGANAIQLYSGMIYQGPSIAADICGGLARELKRQNLASISQICASQTDRWAKEEDHENLA